MFVPDLPVQGESISESLRSGKLSDGADPVLIRMQNLIKSINQRC